MNHRIQTLKQIIKEHPDTAILLKNKYRVIAGAMQRMYPLLQEIPQDKLADIVFDAIAADRELRILNQGKDQENKTIAEQKYLLHNGYEIGYNMR